MFEEYIPKRIAQLRNAKRVSAREMSLSVGQNKNYIAQIENGQTLPSLPALLFICDYLGIHPREFFDDGTQDPVLLHGLEDKLKQLTPEQLSHISALVEDILG